MATKKVTKPEAATNASKTIRSKKVSGTAKTAAGSALSQTKSPKKVTSPAAASTASKVLRDPHSSKTSKSAAGSALAQREVQRPAHKGKVPSSVIKKAVKQVSRARKK